MWSRAAAPVLLDTETSRAFLLSYEQLEPVPVALMMVMWGVFNSLSSDLFTLILDCPKIQI